MKKMILALGILILSIGLDREVYAGSLNEYEADIMKAAQGVFEYDGIKYRLDKTYINMALEYLMNDEVDLTGEQRDKVLGAMNSYIESGVKDGYLISVDEEDTAIDPESEDDQEEVIDALDQSDEGTKENGAAADTEDNSDQTKEQTKAQEAEETKPQVTQAVTAEPAESAELQTEKENEGTQGDFFGGLLAAINSTGEASSPADADYVEGSDASEIIKNTGFNLNTTVIVAVLMGVLMLAGMIVTMKNNYFAHSDE